MPDDDLTSLTDDELQHLGEQVRAEVQARRTLATAEQASEALALRYRRAVERAEDAPGGLPTWVQPTGAHDAYPLGRTVTHNGKTWENITPANVWEPGVSGWREQVSEGYPEWVRPTGAHDAYNIGDRVTFNGSNYESAINGNTWSPTEYPAGWKVIP